LLSGAAGGLAAEGAHDYLPNVPGVGEAAGEAAGVLVGGAAAGYWPSWLSQTADLLGESNSLQEAGAKVQEAAQRHMDVTIPAAEQQAWGQVDSLLKSPQAPRGPVTPPTNLEAALASMTSRGGNWNAVSKVLRPTLADELQT